MCNDRKSSEFSEAQRVTLTVSVIPMVNHEAETVWDFEVIMRRSRKRVEIMRHGKRA